MMVGVMPIRNLTCWPFRCQCSLILIADFHLVGLAGAGRDVIASFTTSLAGTRVHLS